MAGLMRLMSELRVETRQADFIIRFGVIPVNLSKKLFSSVDVRVFSALNGKK